MAEKKLKIKPDLGGLVGSLSAKRNELTPSPMQKTIVVPEQEQGITPGAPETKTANKGGRGTVKDFEKIEYTRLSPKIPSELKTELDIAVARKNFKDKNGLVIKTIDEFVAEAVYRMIQQGQ